MRELRAGAAVIGVGESDLGKLPESDGAALRLQASARAMLDAGVASAEVDGLFTTAGHGFQATDLAEKLELRPSHVDSTLIGGASFVSYLRRATLAIVAGLCHTVLVAYGESSWANTRRTKGLYGGQHALVPERVEFEDVAGNFLIASYAMAARRHMHEFGTTPEQLAAVAVAAHEHAARHPNALAKAPITVDDVLSSRPVAEPLHLLDCSLVSDGGGAFVVTAADRAMDAPHRPVFYLGGGEATTHNIISLMPDLTTTAAVQSGRQALQSAEVAIEDIDVVEIYDAFSHLPIMFLEDLGFCPKGEGGPFVASGVTRPGGELPMNTHGGALAYAHPGMQGVFLVIEAVHQLRGSAGERQVPDASIALVHGNGGVFSHQATAVLGTTP